MSLEIDTNSTTNLNLPKLPCIKPKESTQKTLTTSSISVPFQWEEVPGKPRVYSTTADAAPACLDLPPRLLCNDDDKFTITPSGTTSLDGPYVGRSLSLMCTFSFRKGPLKARGEGCRPGTKCGARSFDSGRWGSFKEEEVIGKGSFDFSTSLGDGFQNERITRVGRKRSFFTSSSMNSNLWADIYASFKHAVPWRRRR